MRKTLATLFLVAVATASIPSASATSADPVRASHDQCSITVIGQKASGELITTAPRCFATQAEVQRDTAAARATVLARHYKQAGGLGPALTINGSDCNGGWVNFSGSLASWRNTIVSTRHVLCPVVRHWSGFNKTGAMDYHAYPALNLDSLIAASSSASYHNS